MLWERLGNFGRDGEINGFPGSDIQMSRAMGF